MNISMKAFIASAIVLSYSLSYSNSAQASVFKISPGAIDRSLAILTATDMGSTSNDSASPALSPIARSELITNAINTGDKTNKTVSQKSNVVRTLIVTATGYSSTPDQTDSTPCNTATGYNVCTGNKNVIAANFSIDGYRVPFGTLVRIPEIYGDKIFVVEDRMNSRYKNNIDIWFRERNTARNFGLKKVTIEIVPSVDGQLADNLN